MAAGATYEPIATQTLGSAASSITFSSIASSWTDLRVVLTTTTSVGGQVVRMRYNSDTSSSYSYTEMYGFTINGTTNVANAARIYVSDNNISGTSTTIPSLIIIDVFSYAGGTYKTSLVTASQNYITDGAVTKSVNLWRNTSGITTIEFSIATGNFNSGTTATLYGIKNA